MQFITVEARDKMLFQVGIRASLPPVVAQINYQGHGALRRRTLMCNYVGMDHGASLSFASYIVGCLRKVARRDTAESMTPND